MKTMTEKTTKDLFDPTGKSGEAGMEETYRVVSKKYPGLVFHFLTALALADAEAPTECIFELKTGWKMVDGKGKWMGARLYTDSGDFSQTFRGDSLEELEKKVSENEETDDDDWS
jgi:hypothetical protein